MEQISNELLTERLHLFTPNIYIGMKADVIGITDDEMLEQAIHKACEKVEVLHQKIVLDETGRAYYTPCKPDIRIEYTYKDYSVCMKEVTQTGMDIWNGELIHFYIRKEGVKTELAIIAHHLVGDGLSILYLLEMVMKQLSNQKIEQKSLVVMSAEDFPKKCEVHRIAKRYLTNLNHKWLKQRKVYTKDDWRKINKEYAATNQCEIFHEIISDNELLSIIQDAKKIGVTVNTYIATAAIRSYEKKSVTGMALSVRNRDDKKISNAASGLSITYQYNKNRDFAWNARIIDKQIEKLKKSTAGKYFALKFQAMMDGSFLDGAAVYKYLKQGDKRLKTLAKLMMYDDHPRDIGISNLTRANIESEYGPYSLRNLVFVAPVVPYSERIIAVVTLGNEMSITMHTVARDKDKEKAFFESMIKVLKEDKS